MSSPPEKQKPAASEATGFQKCDGETLYLGTTSPASAQVCVLGIDPGQGGALSFYFPEHAARVSVYDMPVAGDHVDAAGLAERIAQMRPDIAVIEAVHSMPKQGVASSFKFGRSFGVVIGVVAALRVPAHFVTPGRWKRYFRLTSDKEAARALALQYWPANAAQFQRKKDADRAEAALLARYGAEQIMGGAP